MSLELSSVKPQDRLDEKEDIETQNVANEQDFILTSLSKVSSGFFSTVLDANRFFCCCMAMGDLRTFDTEDIVCVS